MTNVQTQKLRMYVALLAFLKSNKDVLAKLPNIDGYITDLDTVVTRINADIELQKQSLADLTKQKNQLQANLIDNTVDVSRKFQAYAAYSKNDALLKAVKFTESDLIHLIDIELLQTSKSLYAKVNTYLAALTPYGLTADTQTAFGNNITLYENVIPELNQGKRDRKSLTIQISDDFDTADTVIDNIDLLVEVVHISEPKFYSDYQSARKVGTVFGTVQLLGKVTDAASGDPIANVTAAFTLNGNSEPDIIKQTATKGGFMVKSIEQGIYAVDISKFGYQTQKLSIAVSADEPYNLNVKLVKS